MKQNGGFTLVEILVAIAVSSVMMMLLVQIFLSSLRGNNKAQIVSQLKQNGQTVLENLDKSIRNADNIACISPTGRTLVFSKNGLYTRYRFTPATNSTNGEIREDMPGAANAEEQDPNALVIRICNDSDPQLPSSSNVIIDNNTQTGVKLVSGSFGQSQASGFKDVVTIQFELEPTDKVSRKVLDQIDPIPFTTSVELR